MAKLQKTMSFTNATIDIAAGELVEYSKDGDPIGRFPLSEIFKPWDNVYGISLTIKRSNEMFTADENGEGAADDHY